MDKEIEGFYAAVCNGSNCQGINNGIVEALETAGIKTKILTCTDRCDHGPNVDFMDGEEKKGELGSCSSNNICSRLQDLVDRLTIPPSG